MSQDSERCAAVADEIAAVLEQAQKEGEELLEGVKPEYVAGYIAGVRRAAQAIRGAEC